MPGRSGHAGTERARRGRSGHTGTERAHRGGAGMQGRSGHAGAEWARRVFVSPSRPPDSGPLSHPIHQRSKPRPHSFAFPPLPSHARRLCSTPTPRFRHLPAPRSAQLRAASASSRSPGPLFSPPSCSRTPPAFVALPPPLPRPPLSPTPGLPPILPCSPPPNLTHVTPPPLPPPTGRPRFPRSRLPHALPLPLSPLSPLPSPRRPGPGHAAFTLPPPARPAATHTRTRALRARTRVFTRSFCPFEKIIVILGRQYRADHNG